MGTSTSHIEEEKVNDSSLYIDKPLESKVCTVIETTWLDQSSQFLSPILTSNLPFPSSVTRTIHEYLTSEIDLLRHISLFHQRCSRFGEFMKHELTSSNRSSISWNSLMLRKGPSPGGEGDIGEKQHECGNQQCRDDRERPFYGDLSFLFHEEDRTEEWRLGQEYSDLNRNGVPKWAGYCDIRSPQPLLFSPEDSY